MRAALITMLFLSACEPVVDTGYRGESLFSFSGRIETFSQLSENPAPYRVSVFWLPDSGETALKPELLDEQASVSVSVTFPLAFDIDVFTPPGPDLLLDDGRGFGLGLILAYQDRDGNGRYSPGELVGGSEERGLLYAPEPVGQAASPSGETLAAGFHLTRLPLKCPVDARFRIPTTDCGAPLGAACKSDADCGAGVCLTEIGFEPLPGGACALVDDFERDLNACLPHGGGALEQDGQFYFLGYCEKDSDCRTGEGYVCDQPLATCLPDRPIRIVLAQDFAPALMDCF